ncbi:MAG: ATP-dependent DNA ligase [Verrucomicrobiales bacterium]
MTETATRIPIIAKRGIYLPEADLWLDPWDRQERGFVSHAHSDHFAGHGTIVCSKATAGLIEARFGGEYITEPHMFGRAWTFNEHRLTLLPAGHTLGSAQIHVRRLSDGATLLYSGDFKLRSARTSENTRIEPADTLIMETTFGLPQFRFPSMTKLRNALTRFCRECLEEEEVPVLIGYALGKAQEILAQLAEAGFSFLLHPSAYEMTRAYEAQGVVFPPFEPLTPASDLAGRVLIVPPSAARSQALRKIRNRRLALCSGWALTPGAKYRYQVDEVFPLSDHADFPELLEYVEAVRPKFVFTTHGYAADFARTLRERGFEAWSLGADDQMEFSLGFEEGAAPLDEDEERAAGVREAESEFARFVKACDEVASSPSRLRKIEVLASYFRSLGDAAKAAASARFFCGRAAATREEQKIIATGWAIMRLALMKVTGLNPQRYREIAAGQNDAGRTAFLMLMHGQNMNPRAMELADLTMCIRRLAEARGPLAKAAILETYFRQMSPAEGSYLVKVLTGDMRIGLKEGLVEEALAAAFDAQAPAVREAHMLTGDIGETARLAALGELATASLTVFQPLRPMLASPEESAEGIWQRLVDGAAENSGPGAAAGQAGPPTDAPAGASVWIEDKFDGIRAQLHKQGTRAELFSRDLRTLAAEFPDVVGPALRLPDDVVFDGEIIAFAEGKKLDFFALQKRLGRREPDLFITADVPVRFVVFDLLWHNGETLLHWPLRKRRDRLESLALASPFELIAVSLARSALDIEAEFLAARDRRHEGLIAKDPDSLYTAGRRGKTWLKLKKAYSTLDVVVVRVQQGNGKRSHVLSDYTFAVRDEADDALKVIGKAYSGLTDQEIEELTEHFIAHTVGGSRSARTVVPNVVLEIAFDSIQPSDRHDSGLALRFPRIKAIRRDKTVDEIDTLATARKLARRE